jgi:hypothetical protein
MAHQILQPFGNRAPWAEPAWYTALESPYYNESHRTLRKYVRDYVDENIIPNAEKWEEEGGCAKEVGKLCCARQDLADSRTSIKDIIRFAQAGLALQDQSKGYRGGIPLPANIVDEGAKPAFHPSIPTRTPTLILLDDRVGYLPLRRPER